MTVWADPIARQLVPASAPHGARAIVAGRALDAAGINVSFSDGKGNRIAAPILAQSASADETSIPPAAASGSVAITSGATSLGTFAFTLAADPTYTKVATLVASDHAHDLLKQPSAVAIGLSGVIYIADTQHNQIVAIGPDGKRLFTVGSGKPKLTDGPATQAEFKQPRGIAFDSARGIIYVADTGNNAIRRVTLDGTTTTLAGGKHGGDADFNEPVGLALDASGTLYVADSGNSAVRMVTPAGVVTTLVGGVHGGFADGPVAKALLNHPAGVAVAPDGTIFIADTENQRIRKIAGGIVTTVAGTGHDGAADGAGNVAEFKEPLGLTLDDGGNLFVADNGNNVIREVVMTATSVNVTTLAGSNKPGYTDGPLATAQFKEPAGIAFAGFLFIADAKNDAIRVVQTPPAATAVYPAAGPVAGGNAIRIFGTGFVPGATQAKFGSTAATPVTFVASTEIMATVPAGSAGSVDVVISTPAGTSTLTGAYTYLPPPTLVSVTPAKGKTAGGQAIVFTGTNFYGPDTAVTIAGLSPLSLSVTSPTSLTITTPAGPAGPADIVITTPGGVATKSGAFTYFAPPAIASFAPTQGGAGTTVTITGQNFDPDPAADQVLFGSLAAAITSASPAQLVVTVPNGVTTGKITVTTAGGSVVSSGDFVVASFTKLQVTAPTMTVDVGGSMQLNAIGVLIGGGGTDVTAKASWSASSSSISVTSTGVASALAPGGGDITATLNGLAATIHLTAAAISLPPDPASIAPKLDRTIVSTLADETRFLYSGPNAIQTGVAAGVIDDDRAAVFRGRIIRIDGSPLAGVTVTVLGHPEYGQSVSRLDGMYDLVTNGGAPVTLKFTKNGYISAQRLLTSRWAEQKGVEDVALMAFDPNVTLVAMSAANAQVARGGVTSDDRGKRQATLLFPTGTTASLIMPDGTTAPAASLSVRATEFTVGAQGPNAMPASLPATSGYTYCVELSADEAETAGAVSVKFSNDISLYLENFLGAPAGTVVPFGYYDRRAGKWVAAKNGVVLSILSVSGGLADLDLDGTGSAAGASSLAAIGIDDGERAQLAKLYTPGQSIWRLRTDHFTPCDPNFPVGPPVNSVRPNVLRPQPGRTVCDSCTASGSIIDIHNQALGESIAITGTPYSLDYSTLNTRRLAYKTRIQLSGPTVPTGLRVILLDVVIAGRAFRYQFAPQPNLNYDFAWDGIDAYGRAVQGGREANITISYLYPGVYDTGSLAAGLAWNTSSGQPLSLSSISLARLYPFSQTYIVSMGQLDAAPVGFGGWTLSAQRVFDGRGRVIYGSGGTVRSSDPQGLSTLAMTTVAGNGGCCYAGVGGPATQANLFYPVSIGFAADGTYYLTDGSLIQKVDTAGILTTIGGTGSGGFTPDGTSILGQPFNGWDLAVSPDGVLYVNDLWNARVRAVINGRFVTVAGNGQFAKFDGTDGWGGPATQARLPQFVEGITTGPDGSLYLSCDQYILRVDPDGRLIPIAGGSKTQTHPGDQYNWGDEGPALQAGASGLGIAVGPDGSVYFTDGVTYIRRITPDGVIHLFAGTYDRNAAEVADGQPATSGVLSEPWGITVAPDGSVLFAELRTSRVRRITPDGIITTLAGNGKDTGQLELNGTLARAGSASFPWDVKVAPDGSVYVIQYDSNSVSRLDKVFPAASNRAAVRIIPSEDGSAADVFEQGRHTRTVDTTTGATLQTLGYDNNGYVASITDRSGNVTTIERDALGNPSAIVAPGGQRTSLAVSNGQLTTITDPAGQAHAFTYNSQGLMDSMADPRGGVHSFAYDADGALLKDADPAGGFTTLLRSGNADTFNIQRASAEGRTWSYGMSALSTGDVKRSNVGPDGLASAMTQGGNGITTRTSPDGTQTQTTLVADPRFGMMAPLAANRIVTTPGGIAATAKTTRSVQLADPQNPLSMTSLTNTLTVNGRAYTDVFDVASRRMTSTTPAGRSGFTLFDAQSRPLQGQFASMAPWSAVYDGQGQLTRLNEGSRSSSFAYDASQRLISATDPLSRTVQFTYDAADRVTSQTLPDGRMIHFTYDANGNLTSIAPPSRPAHGFAFTPVDLLSSYTPPVSPVTQYSYNKDRQLMTVTRPDQTTLNFTYDAAGRLSQLTTAGGSYAYAYNATTGTLSSATAPSGTTLNFSYDGGLQLGENWSGTVAGSVSRSYDSDFRVASETVGGAAVNFGYDADSLLTAAGALSLTRDPQNGLLTGMTLGNVTDSWSYDTFGEPLTNAATYNGSAGSSPIMSFSYTRDDAGRITQKNETLLGATTTTAYSYDTAGHLATVTTNGTLTATYAYDQNSNRLSRTTGTSTEAATYDNDDRLLTYNGATYSYTPNGELATRVDASGTTTYSYDSLGNLQHVVLPDGRAIDYVLDPAGRRVGKKINGTLVKGWLYSGQLRIIAETDGTGTIVSRFVYASRFNVPDYMFKGGVTYRILSDHLGSPQVLVDTNTGAIAWNNAYDEFGNPVPGTPDLLPFGFAGGLYDADTKFVHFGAREYDPQTGRWTSKDPIRFGGDDPNLYGYVEGDPVNFFDPIGLEKLNLLPEGDPNNTAANWDRDPSDAILVNSHGSNATVNHMNAKQLARRIRKAKTWKKGRKVILNSCNAARGTNSIAQQLSKKLHTTVVGADQPVWSLGPIDYGTWGTQGASGGDKHGGYTDFSTPGHWITFVDGVQTDSSLTR